MNKFLFNNELDNSTAEEIFNHEEYGLKYLVNYKKWFPYNSLDVFNNL